jgi:hypothetical protein
MLDTGCRVSPLPVVQQGDALPASMRIFSVEKAKEFYVDYLGFSVD